MINNDNAIFFIYIIFILFFFNSLEHYCTTDICWKAGKTKAKVSVTACGSSLFSDGLDGSYDQTT